jgi:hypothetical protein
MFPKFFQFQDIINRLSAFDPIGEIKKLVGEKFEWAVDKNDVMQKRVNAIAAQLIPFADPHLSYHVTVYHSPEANSSARLLINRCDIRISNGIWDANKGWVNKNSNGEIAAVIGHEIVHCVQIQKVGALFFSKLDNIVRQFFEFEADLSGMLYMAKAGYDPSAAVRMWNRLTNRREIPPGYELDQVYQIVRANHPDSKERAEFLEKNLAKAEGIYKAHFHTASTELITSDEISMSSSEAPSSLPLIDASAYISKVAPIPKGKSFLISRLFENPKVLALDFRDAKNMSETMNRMSHYVEQNGKKKVPSLDEAQSALGHDLRIEDVADFYNVCRNEGITLTRGERELLDQLLEAGFIQIQEDEYVSSTPVALIAMSRSLETFNKRKENFIHEYSHALYFVDPIFRSEVSKVFASFPPEAQSFLRGALLASGYYGSNDQWLIETETQAHSMAEPISLNGFMNVILSAKMECKINKGLTSECEDFLSYTGNIRTLLEGLHKKYIAISESHIPFLTRRKGNVIVDEKATCQSFSINKWEDLQKRLKEIDTLSKNFGVLKIETLRNSLEPLEIPQRHQVTPPNPQEELDRLQAEFDENHGIAYSRSE